MNPRFYGSCRLPKCKTAQSGFSSHGDYQMNNTCFRAPADPNETAERRRILEVLRAADNDNAPPPRVDASEDREALLIPELAPRLLWKRLREVSASSGEATTWMMSSPYDTAMPTEAEPSRENLWSVPKLIEVAHAGVDYCLRDGRIVPYGGALEYSGHTGGLVQAGALVLADDTHTKAANDNKEPNEEAEVEAVDSYFAAIADGDRWHRGNVTTRDRRAPWAGSIIGIRHRDAKGKAVTLTRPRNKNGTYRDRKTAPPEPVKPLTGEDVLDARQRLERLLAILESKTVMVLDYSINAPNFKSIGECLGKSGGYAKRFGKKALIKACVELESALEKMQYKYAA